MSVAVVTGAASGLGAAYAKKALTEGMQVVLADVDATRLAELGARLSNAGGESIQVECDVSDSSSVQRLADITIETFGAPSLLINNAGVSSHNGLLWESEANDWQWVFGVNVHGVANGIRAFIPHMLSASEKEPDFSGHVVNVASMGGLFSPMLCGVYSASKHAVVALSEVLNHDLALVTDRIHCSVVCPWFVPTNIARAEENRPGSLRRTRDRTRSETIGARFAEEGMRNAKLSSDDIADLTFSAVRDGKFYIISHPAMMKSVEMRMDDIISTANPREPFSFKPAFQENLRAALEGD